ncbi:MAG TPA: acyl carrier protein [Terriglobales bacterium]|jgi:acyl carrier protein|nr:acyl carrier protein [Terriglobales bacterium]
MTEPSIKEQIHKYVVENANAKGVTQVGDDEPLMTSGVVDSIGIFRLVSFLEDTFRVRIPDEEIVLDNFETIRHIEAFVAGKMAKSSESATAR